MSALKFKIASRQVTHGKRVFVGNWSGPSHWQVRGPLPSCVSDKGEPMIPEGEAFIEQALAKAPNAEPVTFGETYQIYAPYDPCQWRRQVEGESLRVVDAVMVEMIERHCGEGEWRYSDEGPTSGTARGMVVYVVDGVPQAFLAERAPDGQDKAQFQSSFGPGSGSKPGGGGG